MNNEQNERDPDNINNKKKKKESPLLIYSVSKAKKRIVSKFRRRPLSPNTSPSSGFWKRVCFCGIEPDPEDDNFKLRVLLQTNDFFSKDSNPHLCFCSMPLCPFLRHDFPLNSAESSAIKSTGLKALKRTLIFLQYAPNALASRSSGIGGLEPNRDGPTT
ncbi:hypothetical protein AtNW77_Chr3g0161031 [Arabidopsis thaliana]